MFTDRYNPFRVRVVNRTVLLRNIILQVYYKEINNKLMRLNNIFIHIHTYKHC